MAVQMKTESYEFAHGSAPKGRGSWMFTREASHGMPAREFAAPMWMTYAEARAWVKQQVRAEGFQDATVVVGA